MYSGMCVLDSHTYNHDDGDGDEATDDNDINSDCVYYNYLDNYQSICVQVEI